MLLLAVGLVDLRHGHCPEPPSVVADPAFVRLLSFLQPEYKVPPHTQLASLLANRDERAKEETKCLLRAQATIGVALTNYGSTSTTTKFVCDPIVCDAQSSLYGSRKSAVEQRSTNSLLQREMHSGELGRCFPGCSEKMWAVDGPPAKGVSESYHRITRDEAANMVAAGKLRDEADGWESQPALDHHTGCRDVQLWQEIIMVDTLFTVWKCHWPSVPNHSNQ